MSVCVVVYVERKTASVYLQKLGKIVDYLSIRDSVYVSVCLCACVVFEDGSCLRGCELQTIKWFMFFFIATMSILHKTIFYSLSKMKE